jgi:hypothetical protein
MEANSGVRSRFSLVGKAFLPWAIIGVILMAILGVGFYLVPRVKAEVDETWSWVESGLKESGETDKKAEEKQRTKTP